MALGLTYLRAIEAAGGLPRRDAAAARRTRSSRCSTGSTALPLRRPRPRPAQLRRASRTPSSGPTEPELDRFELALARAARRPRAADPGDLPRHPGAQRRRAAARCIQHLPDRHGRHDRSTASASPAERVTHAVESPPAAPLARRARARGRSRSTPSTTRRSTGSATACAPSAWAPDGVVEASRHPDRDFVLGVQWHAESLVRAARAGGAVRRPRRGRRERTRRRPAAARPHDAAAGGAAGWAAWAAATEPAYTVGVEEEVMLLDPQDWSLAQQIDRVLPALAPELAPARDRRDARLGARARDRRPRDGRRRDRGAARRCARELDGELRDARRCAPPAPAPTRSRSGSEIVVSAGERYQFVYGSMRELARREPTFALHVHVGVPDPEAAIHARQPAARPPAAAARAVGQLAVLAGPRHRPGLGAHAAVPGLPARRHPARVRRLRRLRRARSTC